MLKITNVSSTFRNPGSVSRADRAVIEHNRAYSGLLSNTIGPKVSVYRLGFTPFTVFVFAKYSSLIAMPSRIPFEKTVKSRFRSTRVGLVAISIELCPNNNRLIVIIIIIKLNEISRYRVENYYSYGGVVSY